MGQKISQLILYSSDKDLLAQFLGDLFEMEQTRLKEGVKLHSAFLNLLIVGAAEKQNLQADMMINIEFDREDELNDFWHKVQFFKYRYSLNFHDEEKLTRNDSMSYFILNDPDARKWMFSSRHPVS